ncbi:family 16 glycoside hydrolase [Cryphonectria parasitica EP155]|uniref:Family 16 glycoside hydrolase n=1 Tax=Cryphonectria parasitica (strain ATCC 38755 / EP155) TaxID=660469 RepID=A0A9P4XZ59_CRYP1|nr:family 16 glycoside hydrolase [Cryphonectria parasitica EP155]KAF3763450.1 family 16 glycoside hydrolase [Cryphonectria parasitica EP155]
MSPSIRNTLAALSLVGTLRTVVAQYDAPTYSGYTLLWTADFSGDAGTSPSTSNWNIITGYLGVNDELEVYSSSNENLQLSGGSTLQIVPWESDGSWTSGRIESVDSWTPASGVITRVEAEIDFGTNAESTKQGYWPAFWMLPESFRTGAETWPDCGELDILEMIDGVLTGYGTAHCGDECNDDDDDEGLQSSIDVGNDDWHTWRLEWDRTSGNWETETISWSMDGTVFQTLTGGSFDESVWDNLAHQPYYIILNMAVGGSWPGDPNSATVDGYGAMMEVGYVAVYQT